jgi:hypothetical protein
MHLSEMILSRLLDVVVHAVLLFCLEMATQQSHQN